MRASKTLSYFKKYFLHFSELSFHPLVILSTHNVESIRVKDLSLVVGWVSQGAELGKVAHQVDQGPVLKNITDM
jgi:hypothetical protein